VKVLHFCIVNGIMIYELWPGCMGMQGAEQCDRDIHYMIQVEYTQCEGVPDVWQ
jgi:hypothetical protein